MQTNTIMVPAISLTPTLADSLVRVSAELELHRMEAKEAREKLIALLPYATDDQFALVVEAARLEGELPEGCRTNVDFKLSSEQEQILKDVRQERREHCIANKKQYMDTIAADTEQRLVSVKVRVGPKKTVTNLRFEKSQSAPSGLLALARQIAAQN